MKANEDNAIGIIIFSRSACKKAKSAGQYIVGVLFFIFIPICIILSFYQGIRMAMNELIFNYYYPTISSEQVYSEPNDDKD